jgi:hypothetical protein
MPTAAALARRVPRRGAPPARRARWAGLTLLGLAAGTLGSLVALRRGGDRAVQRVWRDLERMPRDAGVFSAALVEGLPDPARRYFLHAIRPGTPLATRVRLVQAGSLRIGEEWAPFTAEQVLVPGTGFAWKVKARVRGLPVTGADTYAHGEGRMRMLLLGLVPVVDATGPELSRSAVGRLVGESMWLPSAWLPRAGATVEPVDADRFAVTTTVDGETTRVVTTVDAQGRLIDAAFPRYGNYTPDKHFQYIPFGGPYYPAEERTFGGYTVPARIRAGWWYGTPRFREDFRIDLVDATYQ